MILILSIIAEILLVLFAITFFSYLSRIDHGDIPMPKNYKEMTKDFIIKHIKQ